MVPLFRSGYVCAVTCGGQVRFFCLGYRVGMPTMVCRDNQRRVALFVFAVSSVDEFVDVPASWFRGVELEQLAGQPVASVRNVTDKVVGWRAEEEHLVVERRLGALTGSRSRTDLDAHTDGNTPCGCLTTASGRSWEKFF